jgi:hypothetical protein
MRRIHGVEDILLGFEPKDAGSIPAGSVFSKMGLSSLILPAINLVVLTKESPPFSSLKKL